MKQIKTGEARKYEPNKDSPDTRQEGQMDFILMKCGLSLGMRL
jgi:hypothetical protein